MTDVSGDNSDGVAGRMGQMHAPGRGGAMAFARRMLIAAVVVLVVGAAAAVMVAQIRILLLAFAGILLGIFLRTVATAVAGWLHVPVWASLTLTCLLAVAVAAGMVWLMAARISGQLDELGRNMHTFATTAGHYLDAHPWGRAVRRGIDQTSLESAATGALGTVTATLTSAGAVATGAFTAVTVALFTAADPRLYVRGVLLLVPAAHEGRARDLLERLRRQLWRWLVGQLVAMAFVGLLTAAVLWVFGVPLVLTLSVAAALLNFVPNFGPLVAAVPAVALAFLTGPATAVWVGVAYLVVQLLQNNLITPLVQREMVDLPPAILILAQIFMFHWAGTLGMMLAPPLAVVAIALVRALYVRDVLGKAPPVTAASSTPGTAARPSGSPPAGGCG